MPNLTHQPPLDHSINAVQSISLHCSRIHAQASQPYRSTAAENTPISCIASARRDSKISNQIYINLLCHPWLSLWPESFSAKAASLYTRDKPPSRTFATNKVIFSRILILSHL